MSLQSHHPTGKDQSQIVKQLTVEIALAAEAGDFKTAERLRDKLIETDPMAIVEAIATAELIEKTMSAAIDKDHLAIWAQLYDQLSSEETNCLFYSLKKFLLPEKRMLLKYGSLNNRLFFLEKGQVTVAIPEETGSYKVLAELKQGDVLGEYTFASIALCSATAVTKTAVQIRCLEDREAEGWDEKHPGLYNKILAFCKNHGRIDKIEQRKNQSKHTYQRHPLKGEVKAILLDRNGQKTQTTFNGELEEMSRSGTSFSIHCNTKATVKKLLTRSFFLVFTCTIKGRQINFSCNGNVVAASSLLYNDYLLHIHFATPLPKKIDAYFNL